MIAHKGLGRSPYKICKLDLSSLKANKNLEFPEIASAFSKPRNDENLKFASRDPPKGLGDDTKSKAQG
ncbi:hypothetical protein [Campylobacter sp.]|uniref:hypothetical protein n=1 Tax=Campylobacter sp. TaxID=205 RepID=UPI002AA7CFE8|nr:hypothetical protein [Campylobacter sp.]